jgi:hypothetical protein
LPGDDTNLETSFSAQEYNDVATDDTVRVEQTATDQYAIFEFKNKNVNNTDALNLRWNGQTSIAPSQATVYLQIYNRVSLQWDIIDSDNSSDANTDFDLTAIVFSDLTNYYDENYWISCRVYQG